DAVGVCLTLDGVRTSEREAHHPSPRTLFIGTYHTGIARVRAAHLRTASTSAHSRWHACHSCSGSLMIALISRSPARSGSAHQRLKFSTTIWRTLGLSLWAYLAHRPSSARSQDRDSLLQRARSWALTWAASSPSPQPTRSLSSVSRRGGSAPC